MRRAGALICLGALLLPAPCAAGSPARPCGTVAGGLILEGGPISPGGQQPGPRPIPGTVQFMGYHQRITVRVDRSGKFAVQLPAGRYEVSDRSPRLLEVGTDGIARETWSYPRPVTVIPHHTTKITLTTIVP